MKNGDARIGVAWKEAVDGHPERSRYTLKLSLGIAGQVPCRIVDERSLMYQSVHVPWLNR